MCGIFVSRMGSDLDSMCKDYCTTKATKSTKGLFSHPMVCILSPHFNEIPHRGSKYSGRKPMGTSSGDHALCMGGSIVAFQGSRVGERVPLPGACFEIPSLFLTLDSTVYVVSVDYLRKAFVRSTGTPCRRPRRVVAPPSCSGWRFQAVQVGGAVARRSHRLVGEQPKMFQLFETWIDSKAVDGFPQVHRGGKVL